MAEFEVIKSAFTGRSDINYIAAHVGGELSPVKSVDDDSLLNFEHNQTLIACVL
jgi:hypothetical protein